MFEYDFSNSIDDLKKDLKVLKNNIFNGSKLFLLVENLLQGFDKLSNTDLLKYFDGLINDYCDIVNVNNGINLLLKNKLGDLNE